MSQLRILLKALPHKVDTAENEEEGHTKADCNYGDDEPNPIFHCFRLVVVFVVVVVVVVVQPSGKLSRLGRLSSVSDLSLEFPKIRSRIDDQEQLLTVSCGHLDGVTIATIELSQTEVLAGVEASAHEHFHIIVAGSGVGDINVEHADLVVLSIIDFDDTNLIGRN